MDKRKLIAAVVEKTGVKLDEDDPAFLLVVLSQLVLEESANQVTEGITKASGKLAATTTRSVDDFIDVANETLAKFIHRTNELKNTLDEIKTTQSIQPINATVITDSKAATQSWGFVVAAFVLGVSVGSLIAFLALK